MAHGLNSCCSWALGHSPNGCGSGPEFLCSMWVLPRSGTMPVSLALAGRFFTTKTPGKPACVLKTLCTFWLFSIQSTCPCLSVGAGWSKELTAADADSGINTFHTMWLLEPQKHVQMGKMNSAQECGPKIGHPSWVRIPSWDDPSVDHMALATSSEQLNDLHLQSKVCPTTHGLFPTI